MFGQNVGQNFLGSQRVGQAAALTVILASQLGLPVSSTHIAIGGVFGVGFLREYLKRNYATQLHKIIEHHDPDEQERLKKIYKEEMVKRSHLVRIAAAWIITVPASAIMAAILFFTLRGLLI